MEENKPKLTDLEEENDASSEQINIIKDQSLGVKTKRDGKKHCYSKLILLISNHFDDEIMQFTLKQSLSFFKN